MEQLVDQIRTVHLTVLVLSLILLATSQVEKRPTLERAADDAQTILQLSERWQEVWSSISKQVDAQIARQPSEEYTQAPGNYLIAIGDAGNSVYETRTHRRWFYQDDIYGLLRHDTQSEMRSWDNLADFLAFWDGVHSGQRAFLPVILDMGSGPHVCSISPMDPRQKPKGTHYGTLALTGKNPHGQWILQPTLNFEMSDVCEFPEVQVNAIEVNLGEAFRQVIPQRWGTGSASQEFPELLSQTKYLENVPIAKLAAALRERANSDPERIEIFGAKLPSSAIPILGPES